MAYTVYRDSVATFLTAKNEMTNASPITLYSIHVKDAAATLYYCEYADGQPITYFIPGTETQQVYTPAPITHDRVESNLEGRVDSVTLTLSNVDRFIGDYLHAYDALRGCTVNILKVFKGSLSDPNSNLRDVYYIDGAELNESTAQFSLTSKFNVQSVTLPMRDYRRDQCQWEFKSDECGYSDDGTYSTCSKTLASCEQYNNVSRFGAFPGIPSRRVMR